MRRRVVITVVGSDRPGIVERVTEILLRHGGNVEDSRMARLGGEFAGIMLASVPDASAASLAVDLENLAGDGISALARPASERAAAPTPPAGVTHVIEVSGVDHEGIVHAVADFLAEQGVNIEELATDMVRAPVSGTPLFNMRALVLAPPTLDTVTLRERLSAIGDRLGVDVVVKLPGGRR